jgi:hypothetical protein
LRICVPERTPTDNVISGENILLRVGKPQFLVAHACTLPLLRGHVISGENTRKKGRKPQLSVLLPPVRALLVTSLPFTFVQGRVR